jgi:P-type Ca2+ transporter type 2C
MDDLLQGLDEAEAVRRRITTGPNALPPPRGRPLGLRLLDQLREPMNLLLSAAATVSGLALGERLDAIAIGAIVVVNAVIALVQEGRAGRALAALEQLSAPEATVVRDGAVRRIPASELVPGDIVRIEAGDRIPADARVLETAVLEVDESMLTGESVPVSKSPAPAATPADDREPRARLLWGTFATRGSGTAVVVSTGPATELGRIAASLDVPSPATPLQQELARLSLRLGTAAVIIATAVFAITLIRTGVSLEGLERSFLSAVALAVAAVPEGLPTVTLVALAVGVRRMAQHRAVVRRLPAVETLGSASVIVTDKTGTITRNRMTVTTAWSLDRDDGAPDELPIPVTESARRIAALVNDATLDPPTGDPMEQALLHVVGAERVAVERDRMPRLGVFPVDSIRMRMSTLHRHPADGVMVLVKGAPEPLLERCTDGLRPDGTRRRLTTDDRCATSHQAATMASDGMRVLALAERTAAHPPIDADEAERALTFVALVGLEDPVRPSATAAVAESLAAGVRVVMATGDHPATALAIARDVGLDTTRPPVSGAEILAHGLPDELLETTIYARVDPTQKLELVRALQAVGEVVAMTGDGVNDAPALRRADIGVALGQRGSDVAREAADMVVTDDDLATVVTATREGRGIYDNIRKVVDYLVAGNLSEIGVVVGALLLIPSLGVPLLPLQLLWINLLTDGLPALALGNDRHDPGLMGHPPRPRTSHLLDRHRLVHLAVRGGLMAAACLATAGIDVLHRGHEPDHTRTVLLTTLVVTHLLYAFIARQPAAASLRDPLAPAGWFGTPWLVAAVSSGLGLQLLIIQWSPAQAVFRTTSLAAADWLLIVGGAFIGLLATAAHRRVAGGTADRGAAEPDRTPLRGPDDHVRHASS